jgi:excinuclease UvrABC nuclease subunit
MCYKNLYEFAYKKHIASLSTKNFTKQTMKNLLEILGFERINKNIIFECNDISHFSGTHTVASRSVIENGKTNPNKYRKFKIKNLKQQEINDFDSMREIAKRRILELEKLKNYPDLIIID